MRITILGCGPSGGVPGVSYGWGDCDPDNPRNRRSRPSILVEDGEATVLVDTSPDLRAQLLAAQVKRLDGVLFTHYHADHLHGIDDLRPINRVLNGPLAAYGDAETLRVIGQRFGYVFEPMAADAQVYYKPTLIPHEIRDGETFHVGGIEVATFAQDHGYCTSMGFRFGPDMAYSTDVVALPEHAFEMLAGVKVWIIGVLVDQEHPTHAHVNKALAWIERVRPERAVLTHMGPWLDYDALRRRLPDGVEPGYDGMVLDA